MSRASLVFSWLATTWMAAATCRAAEPTPAAGGPTLRAGAAAVDVSPTRFPVVVNGGMLSRSAGKLSDPLHARAVVFDDGWTMVAVCVVDSCVLPRDLTDAAKALAGGATGIPAANMMVSATHAHSAPAVMGVLGTDADPHYPPVLRAGIAEAIAKAHANLAPATVAWGVADANAYTGVRRWVRRPDRMLKDPFGDLTVRANMHPGYMSVDAVGPSGPEDPDLTVLSVRAADGRPVALLANFAMHYFSGVEPVSSDYFGRFCTRVAAELKADGPADGKPPFVAIMSQGTSGDLWRVDYTKASKPTITIDQYANDLAKLAVAAVGDKPHRDADVAMAATEIKIKARGPGPERLAWATKVVAAMGDRLPKDQPEIYAREAVLLSRRPEADMLLQAIRVGDFGITAMPNEVYALTGLKIKARSPLPGTMNVELANDELGYIPPPEQMKLGGYTTWPARSSYGAIDAEPRMVEAVLGLLDKVAGKPRKPPADTHGRYAKAVIEAKPVAYWRMNEMAAGSARDAVGRTEAEYEDGVVFWLDGPASEAFNGPGPINRSPHFAGGRMTADLGKRLPASYAVEFWFWNGLAHEARDVTGYLFSRGTDAAGGPGTGGDHLGIGGTSSQAGGQGRLFAFNGGERNQILPGRTTLVPKTWNHVLFVRAGQRVQAYLNGNADPEVSGDLEPTFAAEAGTFFFGGRADNVANLEGKLDEVAVYDRPLTSADAAARIRAAGVEAPGPAPATPAAAAGAASLGPAASGTAAGPATQPVTGMRVSQPVSPTESAKLHRVKAGYELELVAAEPMVMDPVAFNWGPDGRLWVVEMSDYPYGADGKMKAAGRVRFLQDADGDGKYDKSVLFAENLNFPTGVLPWRNGVIVTAAPDVLYLEDADGDGRAEINRVLYTGFTEGNPQLRVNSPAYGLDNWVYLANGNSSKGAVRSIKTGREVQVSGRDVRIRPDTGEIETETGASQFGRHQDDNGDWFGVHNSYPGRHFVIPERYAKRNPHASLPPGYYDLGLSANAKVYPLSKGQKRYGTAFVAQSGRFTSACGVSPYRDDLLFGPRPAGPSTTGGSIVHLFTCEPVHNLVQHLELTPSGATYTAGRAGDELEGEFLASEDEWFRPVFTATGPDGGLWVADMYRFMIEHPDWLPPEGKEDYRPYYRMGADLGRIWRVRKQGAAGRPPTRLDKLSTPELVKALESPNGWQRDLVQAMLVWRNDPAAAPALAGVAAKGSHPTARLHALAALDGLKAVEPGQAERALTDAHPAVRRQALRLAEPLAGSSPALLAAALKLADDPDPKVRAQLAFSVGEWDGAAAGRALAKLAAAAGDDVYATAAVMTSAGKHYAALADGLLAHQEPPTGLLRDLQSMALARGDRDLLAELLAPVFVTRGGTYTKTQVEAFGRLLDTLGQQKTSLAKLAGTEKDTLAALLAASNDVFAAARVVAGITDKAPADRIVGINVVGRDPGRAADDVKLLAAVYAPGAPPAVQSAAVRSLARVDRPEVPGVLLARWADRPAEVRSAVADAMLGREPWAFALLERVRDGDVQPTDLDAARRQRLVRHASPRVKQLAAEALGDLTEAGRAKVVEQYRAAIASAAGDPSPGRGVDAAAAARGQKVFVQNCATCHVAGGQGVEIGPNLASVAGWPADALLTGVLDPSRSLEPRYLAHACTLDTGDVVYGIVLRETPAGVTMKGLDGVERTIPRGQVKSLESTNKSLMPEGIEAAVDPAQMADLIQFLQSQKP